MTAVKRPAAPIGGKGIHTDKAKELHVAAMKDRAQGNLVSARMNLKLDVAYLSAARVILNHDPSIVINAASVTSYAADFAKRIRTEIEKWQKVVAAAGVKLD